MVLTQAQVCSGMFWNKTLAYYFCDKDGPWKIQRFFSVYPKPALGQSSLLGTWVEKNRGHVQDLGGWGEFWGSWADFLLGPLKVLGAFRDSVLGAGR